jgi:hypothetical protein
VKASLGKALIPAFGAALGFITNKVIPIFSSLASIIEKDGLAGVIEKVKEKLPELREAFVKYANAAWEWIKDAYPPALKAMLGFVYDIGQWFLNTGLPFIAEQLGKGAKALWEWIQKAAPPALQRLGKLIGDLANWLLDKGLPMMVDKLIQFGNAFVDWIKPLIVPMLQKLGELVATILTWIVTDAVPKLAAQAYKIGGALLGWLADLLPAAVKGIGKFVAELVPKIPGLFFSLIASMVSLGGRLGGDLVSALVDALKGLGSKGLDIGKSFANAIIRFINANVIKKINDLLEFELGLPFGKKFTVNPPDLPPIPELKNGGIVSSPTLALIGEAGPEAVIPLSRGAQYGVGAAGGGGSNITVNVNGGDPNSIVRALQQYVRQSGPVPVNTRTM